MLDENTKILESVTIEYQYTVSNNDWVELGPDEVFNAIVKGIKELSEYHNDIGAVGFDTFFTVCGFHGQGRCRSSSYHCSFRPEK